MCFAINYLAVRPLTTKVYRWLQRLSDGSLVSPHRSPEASAFSVNVREYFHWTLGETKTDQLPSLDDCHETGNQYRGDRAERGLYVWLNEEAARSDLRKFIGSYNVSPRKLVLVECEVHPLNWLYSSDDGDAATYRAVRPVRILEEFARDQCQWSYISLKENNNV